MIFPNIARRRGARRFDRNLLGFLAGVALLATSLPTTQGLAQGADAFSDEQIEFFTEEVRPILERSCFSCHGGIGEGDDAPTIKSEFQIISRLGILKGGAYGPAFDPENPERSLLLDMISYRDEDHEMPPKGKLPDAEIATLNKWVMMGLPWTPEDANFLHEIDHGTNFFEKAENYWSYQPVADVAPPVVEDPDWAKNPIDAFIFDRLAKEGLSPNETADPRTLIRRAYYNLTGLPPTPADVEKWAQDWSPDRWTELVETLLASPHYGETWGRHWLDIMRYAESNGFERDSTKSWIWRYRDYVINSLNDDKPYDRFILEQLAGDEIPEPTPESKIATGYYRLMQWDDEPADRLQHMYDVLDDNLRVTAEGFLGMTLGCARCHDHKGDPLLQTDYYEFMSYFRGVTNHSKNDVIETIEIPALAKATETEKEKDRREASALRQRLESIRTEARERILAEKPNLAVALGFEPEDANVLIPTSTEGSPEWRYTVEQPDPEWSDVGYRGDSEWAEGEGGFGRGRVRGARRRTTWDTDAIWLRTTFGLEAIPQSLMLTVYHDEDIQIYLNGQEVFSSEGYVNEPKRIDLDEDALRALQTGRNTVAVHCIQTTGGQFVDVGLTANTSAVSIDGLITDRFAQLFTDSTRNELTEGKARLEELENKTYTNGIQAMVVQERGMEVEPTHVHIRGNAHAEGKRVQPDVPAIFGLEAPEITPNPNGTGTSGRRLALAKWIIDDRNPRTARVMVNRIWRHHFGQGICPTPSDFGFLGMEPTHPELLDWLAQEFIRQDYSIKAMHRLIMRSKAYQMSSKARSPEIDQDPTNRLYWRFNMRRLTAEEIRDSMLSVVGELNPKVGGPSFYPVLQPAVLATSSTGAGKWGESTEEETHRRSVYIHVKRSLKPPVLADFDFADTDAPCPERFVTTVPTQALNMLNGPLTNSKAETFAARLTQDTGDDDRAFVKRGIELVTARPAEKWELDRGVQLIQELETEHGLDTRTARERFALMALNLNEFVYLD